MKQGNDTYIGVFIGNWDKGGHTVSLRIKYFEESEYQNNIKWVQPLFNTLSYMEMEGQGNTDLFRTDTLKVSAVIPDGLKNIKLKFVTTGHGNDEFTPKVHKILVDGMEVLNLIPWRTDCASYRENNPSSGNFPNGMSSSDYSCSNWCPGIVVTPYEIKLDGLEAGKHKFQVIIPSGENSYWNVSGCLTGE
ncbi:MAG: peptide-N-glycosidase F-related protein [Candidatus Kapaibacterium sp.]